MRIFQTTIAGEITLSGVGVHSGAPSRITFRPADPGHGIVFRTVDRDGRRHPVEALVSRVAPSDLSTTLTGQNGQTISTVEHAMAAIAGSAIDNLEIDIDGPEVPIMDGTSLAFIDAFEQAGIVEQAAKRRYIRILRPVRIESGNSWAEFGPYDSGSRYEVEIDFDTPVIGRQKYAGDMQPAAFRGDISNARTFGFMRDVERLWAAGLALGSSLDNSLVIGDDNTIINPGGLRHPDEFVRHKTLDAIGDLALAGAPFIGCFRSYRGGHRLNAAALRALFEADNAYEMVELEEAPGGTSHVPVTPPVPAPGAA